MNSHLSEIYQSIIAKVSAAVGIKAVESSPNDVDVWLDQVRVTADRMPIAHVGVTGAQTAVDATTDGDMQEVTKFVITVLFTYNGTNTEAMIGLRDAVITSVCNIPAMSQNGFALLTDYNGWEFVANYQEVGMMKIHISVTSQWSLA